MCDHNAIIDRYTVAHQLNEALNAIEFMRKDVENGEDADPAMWIFLASILDNLCLAWHRRFYGPDDIRKESQEDFELKTVSVPNWGGRFQLVEIAASHPAVDLQLSRQKIDQDTVFAYLHAAEDALTNLLSKVENGLFDSCGTMSLGSGFEPILENLCLAWHLRYLSCMEISKMDPTAKMELASWLPRWQWNLRLIPAEEEL